MTNTREPGGTLRRALEALLGVPFATGNSVEVLANGDAFFPRMLEGIRASTRSVDMLWFLWGTGEVTDQVADALADRAAAGVRVRVLLDAFGSHGAATEQIHRMREAGAQVEYYHPVPGVRPTTFNVRSHRRALVCDEAVAFTGGIGIDTAWTGDAEDAAHWRDTGYRVVGPAVAGIRSAFARAWLQTPALLMDEHDEFPEPSRPGEVAVQVLAPESRPGWNSATLAVETMLELAEQRVRLATPYCRLPRRLLPGIAEATRRGVRVQLMVPGEYVDRPLAALQGRHGYAAMLEAGAEIWEYRPTMLHNKLVTVDGRFAMVGTTNVDTRSFALNEQVAMLIDDEATVGRLDADYDHDLDRSVRLDQREWATRPLRKRATQTAAYVAGYPIRGLGALGLTSRDPSAVHRLRRRRA